MQGIRVIDGIRYVDQSLCLMLVVADDDVFFFFSVFVWNVSLSLLLKKMNYCVLFMITMI